MWRRTEVGAHAEDRQLVAEMECWPARSEVEARVRSPVSAVMASSPFGTQGSQWPACIAFVGCLLGLGLVLLVHGFRQTSIGIRSPGRCGDISGILGRWLPASSLACSPLAPLRFPSHRCPHSGRASEGSQAAVDGDGLHTSGTACGGAWRPSWWMPRKALCPIQSPQARIELVVRPCVRRCGPGATRAWCASSCGVLMPNRPLWLLFPAGPTRRRAAGLSPLVLDECHGPLHLCS